MEDLPMMTFSFENIFKTQLTNKKAIIIIILLGFLVFGDILFNGFALDDTSQILNNAPVHSLSYISSFFQGSTFGPNADGSGITEGFYYKPLLTTFYAILYAFSGGNAFTFHLFQLILYISNALFIFYLFCRFFPRKIAFFLSLIFLVHPINVETVANIASLQDVLFLFFGMLGMVIIISNYEKNKNISIKEYIVISLLLFCSLLSKETGILFIFIFPVYMYLFLKKFDKRILLFEILSLTIYFILRFFVGHVYFSTRSLSPIAEVSFLQRIVNIPAIILYYLKTFFFPINLITGQQWVIKNITFSSFVLPLLIDVIAFIVLATFGFFIYKREHNHFRTYLFFTFWFCVGLLLHLQIFPLDGTVADRWFYFPMIGLIGIIGLGIEILFKNKNTIPWLIFFGTIILIAFSIRSIYRNTNWYSTYTIVSHDITYEEDNSTLQNTLAIEYLNKGDQTEALKHFQIAYSLEPDDAVLSNIALIYAIQGDYVSAEKNYSKLMVENTHYYPAYINFAHTELKANNPEEALFITKKGVTLFPKSDQLWILSSFAKYELGYSDYALIDLDKAYTLSQNNTYLDYKRTMLQHQSINGYL